MLTLIQDINLLEPDYHQVYVENRNKFRNFNGTPNNCSNTVRTFLSLLGVNIDNVTAWADTVRNLGQVLYNPSQLKRGDIVAMGRPGDTWHVGVYLGENQVLHQSAMRGYKVGVYNDIRAFINYRRGFYIVRPSYQHREILDGQFFTAPAFS